MYIFSILWQVSGTYPSFHIPLVSFCGQVEQQSRQLYFSFLFIIIWTLLFTYLEFLTSVLADGFSLEFEWHQVFSSLWDS